MSAPSQPRTTSQPAHMAAAVRLVTLAFTALASCIDPKPAPTDSASSADAGDGADLADVAPVDTIGADTAPWQPS